MIFNFDNFELDTELFELTHNGQVIPMEPQVFNVLAYLIQHHDRVISKQELLDSLWEGRIVSESTLNTSIKAVRKAVNDNGQDQKVISTIYRRGFRFISKIQNPNDDNKSVIHNSDTPDKIDSFIHEETPSIVVVPFSHDPEDNEAGWWAEVFSDDLSIHLARIPGFTVISKNSAAHFKQLKSSPQQIGKALNASYLIEGSIRRINNSFRISVQLIETRTNHLLWANHKQVSTDAIEDFQIVAIDKIVGQIEPELNRAEISILYHRKPTDLGAWSLYRQASNILGQKGWSEETLASVTELLSEAIKRDPELAFAHAYLSLTIALGHLIGLVHNPEWKQEAIQAAEMALSLDSQDSDVLGYVGCAFSDMGDFQRGIPLMQRAIEINPSNAQAWAALGAAKLKSGDESGVEEMQHGLRISPLDNRLAVWGAILARGLLSYSREDEAIAVAKDACIYDDIIFFPRAVLAIAYSTVGNKKASLTAWQDAQRIRPQLCLNDINWMTSPKELEQLQALGII